ncbi:hypothetical protein J0H58_10690 [bacterium]|nr:hypothetical protein [bacterium]
MASLVRIGLGLLLALAPALCCCQARWLTASAAAASAEPAPAPKCPLCCKAEEPTPTPVSPEAPAPKPMPASPHCVFCDGQGSVIPTDPQPRAEAPAFTGELLPALAFLAAIVPVQPAFSTGVFPSERAGVDARFAALFGRHVLRC